MISYIYKWINAPMSSTNFILLHFLRFSFFGLWISYGILWFPLRIPQFNICSLFRIILCVLQKSIFAKLIEVLPTEVANIFSAKILGIYTCFHYFFFFILYYLFKTFHHCDLVLVMWRLFYFFTFAEIPCVKFS